MNTGSRVAPISCDFSVKIIVVVDVLVSEMFHNEGVLVTINWPSVKW